MTVLRDEWRFGGRFVEGSTAPEFDDDAFAVVTLPHCVADLSWHEWQPADWAGEWIYRRRFDRPAGAGRLFLDFAGVMSAATVTLNGHEFPKQLGGYLPVSYEITDLVRDRGNALAVLVDGSWLNVPPDGSPDGPAAVDYMQPAGIHRDVTLRLEPATFIADLFAKPLDVLSADRRVEVSCTIDSADPPVGDLALTVAVRLDGQPMADTTVDIQLVGSGRTVAAATLDRLPDVRLWDVDSPTLYDVVATLTLDGAPIHRQQRRIGFREARFERDGFYLNGRRLQLFGLNRHSIYPYVGMAMPARVQRKDAEILARDFNCNMVRCSHYPQTTEFLDACDELGLLVWEEPPGWQYVGDEEWQELLVRDVHDMIVRDRNHPSVVIWGVHANESAIYPELYTRTRNVAYELDGTRQTSGSLTSQSTEGWVQDVFAFDDYSHDAENALLKPPVPDVPYLVAEAVGALDGPHYYRWTDGQDILAKQAYLHAQVHDAALSDDRYSGLVAWCAFDYASQNGYTYKSMKTPGVADIFRVPKPGAAFYRSQVDPRRRPVLEPAFFWDFGPESPPHGPGPGALIGSNCDRVEAYVDGTHVDSARRDPARFPHLEHAPYFLDLTVDPSGHPELRLDGYLGGELVISRSMSADPTGDRLRLDLDDNALVSDGSDATRAVFRAVDAYGNQRPFQTGEVALSITGPAALIGDNPFSFADIPGVGAVWVRSLPGQTGVVTVTATHPVLGTASGQFHCGETQQ
ncbi:MAG TPA: glycoside hydrolase family 2 TIM barrel-domain containing protein [Mycobacteriales bacterium]|nr:glycoside hydrolase family 2 TIM barrel-domain containing protein [Mycobacteriales bacterium]